jgi:hypothetical protein
MLLSVLTIRPATVAALAAAVGALAGCGSAGRPPAAAQPAEASPVTPVYLAPGDVSRRVANSFRASLYELAVMSQPPDSGAALGQPLPTGQLRSTHCSAAGPRPGAGGSWSWRCTVGWTTQAGMRQRTSYAVQLRPTGCFDAAAAPARPNIRDASAGTFGIDPLNALSGAQQDCR